MNVLHVSLLSPHAHRATRMFRAYGPAGLAQEWVQPGETPLGPAPDLVVVHAVNQHVREPERWAARGIPVVGWMWNTDWRQARGAEDVEAALSLCGAIVGADEGVWAVPDDLRGRYVPHKPLVDASVFGNSIECVRSLPVFVARGWTGHPLYWVSETAQALDGMPGVLCAPGHLPPGEMAKAYRKAKCVVALREDCGPSYTVVEAALCGAMVVASDCPAIRRHFLDGGAVLAKRHPQSIREAVELCLGMPADVRREQQARNARYFADWTLQAQGPRLVEQILAVAGMEKAA